MRRLTLPILSNFSARRMRLSECIEVEAGERWMAWGLEDFLLDYGPGSYDPPWSWNDEYHNLINLPETQLLIADIREHGIKRPILIGDDHRVWDGHHRIVAAIYLGYKQIPVQLALGNSPESIF